MAKAKVPGLSNSSGNVGGDFHLDNGDYLVEVREVEFQPKPKAGMKTDDPSCPYQYAWRLNILGGPVQESGEDPQGKSWTWFSYIDPDHEWTQLMVDRLKNALNAFGVAVRADSFDEKGCAGKQAVMAIRNKKRKDSDEMRSEVSGFKPASEWGE